jgi:hypothetical protein
MKYQLKKSVHDELSATFLKIKRSAPTALGTVTVKTVRVSLIPSKVTTNQASPASS